MADEKQLKQARAAFQALCEMLDEKDWHYKKDDEHLQIVSGARGDDLPIDIRIAVDADRQLVMLFSQIPVIAPESRRAEMAVAVSRANCGMIDGSFDYDYQSGEIIFRMTSSFRDSLVGKEVFEYMLFCSCFTVDKYNDKFLMVAKSDMSNEEIVNFIE